jgi:hypothetical protein
VPGLAQVLPAWEDEVYKYCQYMGWYEEDVPFRAAMSLLHEEVSEAGHSWREWGLADGTSGSASKPGGSKLAKPEGVGSELADVLIRLLDDSRRYDLGLPRRYARFREMFAFDPAEDKFLVHTDILHGLISKASDAWEDGIPGGPALALTRVLGYTDQMAEFYGQQLGAEYRRKLEYNYTRPHRHGGRRA